MRIEDISIFSTFVAGLLSFISLSTLLLIPGYVAYLRGSIIKLDENSLQKSVLWQALVFMAGFTFVFVILFGMPVNFLSGVISRFANIIVIIGGLVLIIFGPYVIFKTFMGEKLQFHDNSLLTIVLTLASYARSAFIGMTFAAAWTPPIGPLLGAILTLAIQGQNVGLAMFYLFAYAIGLGVFFFLVAWILLVFNRFRASNRYLILIEGISSGFIIFVFGILFVTGIYTLFNAWGNSHTPDWLLEYL